jgi:predicted transcriptional regulator
MQDDATRITVSLPPEVYREVVEIARASNVSISWVMRYAAERLLVERRSGKLQQLSLPIERNIRMSGNQS